MGCDIHGAIEVNQYSTRCHPDSNIAWETAVHLDKVLSRSYTLFGRLSHDGRRQKVGDTAIFAGRGLPPKDNLGRETREWYEDGWGPEAHHESHFTHSELYQEKVRINVGGEPESFTPIEYLRDGLEEYNPEKIGLNVSKGRNNSMSYGRHKRAWESAFSISEALAESNGIEQVRWVIWFDN